MKLKLLYIFILSGVIFSGIYTNKEIKILDYKGLEPFLNKNNDTTYVINFWATWCKPCIEELPDFGKLYEKYKNDKVHIILVSLDFPSQIKSNLIPYVEKNKIKPDVFLLDDPRSNYWIDEIEKSWSGAIPATIIYKGKSREFFEKSMTFNELDSIVKLNI